MRYVYDSGLRVLLQTNWGGLVTSNNYFASGTYGGFLAARVDLGFRTNSYTYTNGNVYTHTDELGLAVTNVWDDLNRLVCRVYPDGTTTSNWFDATKKLNLVAQKDRLNRWTYFGYNALRQLTAVTNANNQVTLYNYCNCGSLDQVTRLNGSTPIVTSYTYDFAGRRTTSSFPDGYSMSYDYEYYWPAASGYGGMRVTDSSGLVVHAGYADYGELATVGLSHVPNASVEGYLLARTFDHYGRLVATTDRNGITTTNGYDVLGRITNRVTLDIYSQPQSTNVFAYTSRGLTNSIDELGHKTWFVYDAAGRLRSQTNANQEALQFSYNPADQIVTLLDGKNQQTSWGYDEYGRVTNKLDAVREIFRYKYDQNHHLTNRWTAQKGDTYYRYDSVGNLTNVDYPGAVMDITLTYDLLNRLTNVVDAIGTTKFSYTDAGQLLSEDGPWANDTVSYTYDARRRASLAIMQANASPWSQTYGYDQYNRLSNTISAAGTFLSEYWSGSGVSDRVSYLGLGGISSPTEHHHIDNAHDTLGRLLSTTLYVNGTVGNQHSYIYNAANQRTRQTFMESATGNYVDYTYDDIGQLKTAKGWESGGTTPRLNEQFGYEYDKAWNLNRRTNNALVQTFGLNNLNELTNATRSGTLTVAGVASQPGANLSSVSLSANGGAGANADVYADGSWAKSGVSLNNGANDFTATATDTLGRTASDTISLSLPSTNNFSYDYNGNLTNDGRRVFEYDYENQLTNVYVASAWRSEFKYDAFGRRRVRKEYTWQSSAWVLTNEVRYVYDGMLTVQERDANNLAMVSYTRGNDLSGTLQGAGGIGGLLARTDNSKLLSPAASSSHAYYHCDGNGNVTAMVDTNGIVVAEYNYDPYGNLLGMAGPLAEANAYRFSSKEYQGNAGLYYYGYRFYEPNLQRWLTRDPLQEAGGIALFTFAHDNPLFFTDAWGQSVDWGCMTPCLADAALNFGLGFIPGFNAASMAADLLGLDIQPFQSLTGNDSLVSINPGASDFAAGASDFARVGAKTRFAMLGGQGSLARMEKLADRPTFLAKPVAKQAKMLSKLGMLRKAAKLVSSLGTVANLLNIVDFGCDAYSCYEKCNQPE